MCFVFISWRIQRCPKVVSSSYPRGGPHSLNGPSAQSGTGRTALRTSRRGIIVTMTKGSVHRRPVGLSVPGGVEIMSRRGPWATGVTGGVRGRSGLGRRKGAAEGSSQGGGLLVSCIQAGRRGARLPGLRGGPSAWSNTPARAGPQQKAARLFASSAGVIPCLDAGWLGAGPDA